MFTINNYICKYILIIVVCITNFYLFLILEPSWGSIKPQDSVLSTSINKTFLKVV